MTSPAEKAAATRRYNKAYAAHEERIAPSEAAFAKVLDELIPERDAKIEAAEQQLLAAQLRFEREREAIMDEFEKAIQKDLEIRKAANQESYMIFHQEAFPDSFSRSA